VKETIGKARGVMAAVGRALPHGGTLPREDWDKRHSVLLGAVWACVPLLVAYSTAEGFPAWHTAGHLMAVLPLAGMAGMKRFERKIRAAAVSLALLTVCALLIHMSGGLIEMHFTFFVVIVALTLYEDWTVFLLAIAYVLVHHGVMGTLDPTRCSTGRTPGTTLGSGRASTRSSSAWRAPPG
jgi:hypothetical protein